MARTYFTSDTHFNHANIIRYCGRPYTDVDAMNRELIARWNATVRPEDTVYHLGDACMGPKTEFHRFIRRLNGRKLLIAGNHDRPAAFMRACGFAEVHPQLYASVDGLRIWMAHIPIDNSLDERGYRRPPATEPYDLALCGHVHQRWRVRSGCVNVGVDVWDYKPVQLDAILAARDDEAA
jgi:calcineurin-like phosphoesterase family protein